MPLLDAGQVRQAVLSYVDSLSTRPKRVLLIPPDSTRLHSGAGPITAWLFERFTRDGAHADVLPALGTHAPMNTDQLRSMFGPDIPLDRFMVHNWRTDVQHAGSIEADMVRRVSGGRVSYPIDVAVNRHMIEGRYDLIFSVGQVVPHEVIGMAGYTKNVCIGAGGLDIINRSHFLGAVCDMEAIMGRTDTPVRRVIDAAFDRCLGHLPIHFVLTVVQQTSDGPGICGVFCGQDRAAFEQAATLSRRVNVALLDAPIRKAVVYLDPAEYGSTWLGNKAIYRTRMAIADGGELLVLAPGVRKFGEDDANDRLIRKHGYIGRTRVLDLVRDCPDLQANLSVAAHLIHGSSDGRFTVTYAVEKLTRAEVEGVRFRYQPFAEAKQRYDPARLRDGANTLPDGEEVFYVSNPALGLWADRRRMEIPSQESGGGGQNDWKRAGS